MKENYQVVRKALQESIVHWKKNYEAIKDNVGKRLYAITPYAFEVDWEDKTFTTGMDNCSLCTLFYNNKTRCGACPIRSKSGYSGCANTPYEHIEDYTLQCALDKYGDRYIEVTIELVTMVANEVLYLEDLEHILRKEYEQALAESISKWKALCTNMRGEVY